MIFCVRRSLRIFMAGLAGGFQKKQAVAGVVETGRRNETMHCFIGRKLFRGGDLARPWIDENSFCGKIRKNSEIDVNRL